MEYTINDIPELKNRIINGNQIMKDLYCKACKSDDAEYARLIEIYDKKLPLLENLCLTLMSFGYNECLYLDGRTCPTEDGWVCIVCPKG